MIKVRLANNICRYFSKDEDAPKIEVRSGGTLIIYTGPGHILAAWPRGMWVSAEYK